MYFSSKNQPITFTGVLNSQKQNDFYIFDIFLFKKFFFSLTYLNKNKIYFFYTFKISIIFTNSNFTHIFLTFCFSFFVFRICLFLFLFLYLFILTIIIRKPNIFFSFLTVFISSSSSLKLFFKSK